MGQALYEAFPIVRQTYADASQVLGYDIAKLCFDGPAERLNATEYTQPALLTASVAAFRVLDHPHLRPVAVAGHSLGEYSALVAARAVGFTEAVALVQKRGRYMSEAVSPGTGLVAAVLGIGAEALREVCREASAVGVVAAANYNCPGQIVIAGERAAVERAIELAKSNGARKAIALPVSVPVHTPLMKTAADRLATDLAAAHWSNPESPVVNNAEAKALRTGDEIQPSLVRQLPSSVLWEDSIKTMVGLGVKTFVEVGPGMVLTGLIKRIAPDAATVNVHDPQTLDAARVALGLPAPASA